MENHITFRKPDYYTFTIKFLWNLFINFLGLAILYLAIAVYETLWPFNLYPFNLIYKMWPLYLLPQPLMFFLLGLIFAISLLILLFAFLPFLNGNYFIHKFLSKNNKDYVIQITFEPSRFKGIEAILDDADDLGVFKIKDDVLIFNGDSTDMMINKNLIASIEFSNIGSRVMWALGDKSFIKLKEPISEIAGFYMSPRMGTTLWEFRKINRAFIEQIKMIELS